jgi:SPP1 gp7 family putative phage head morphogenesis protein
MPSIPSKEYWQRRAEATLIANEKAILEYEKELRRAYEETIKRVEKEINAFYAKYAKENKIDLATARQRLNASELKSFKQQEKLYFSEATRLKLDPQYRKYLRDLSAKSYISKLEEITANIRHEIEKLAKEFENGLEKELHKTYEDGYYKPLYDIDRTVGLGADFTGLGKRTVEKAIRTNWLDDNFSGRIWKNKTALITQLNQILPQEFVRGRGPKEVAKDLAKRLDVSYSSAVRLARTEMNHISNQATMGAYKDSGVLEKYEYLATLDSRTSDICREMDGKVFNLSQAQTGVNLPPLHPHCRSTTIPWFDEEEMADYEEMRVAKDEDGNYVLEDKITYEQWTDKYASGSYAKRVKKNPKKYEQMNEPVTKTINPLPKTLENFAKHAEEWEKTSLPPSLKEEHIQLLDKAIRDVLENNDYSMRLTTVGFNSVLKDGKFKNQMEVGESRGLYDPTTRKKVPEKLFGVDSSKLEAADFEKYGYMDSKDKAKALKNPAASGYGGVLVTFKRDRVANRTTFTVGDSLDGVLGMRQNMIAGDTQNPRANGIQTYELRTFAATPKRNRTTLPTDAQEFADHFRGEYFEIQYHGDLTLDDVQSVAVSKSTYNRNEKIFDKLKDFGIDLIIPEK